MLYLDAGDHYVGGNPVSFYIYMLFCVCKKIQKESSKETLCFV